MVRKDFALLVLNVLKDVFINVIYGILEELQI